MIEIPPGETAVFKITKHLTYTVKHTGWTLQVESTKRIAAAPNTPESLNVVCIDQAEEDEV